MTALDFIGVLDPLGRLKTMGFMPDFEWSVCALTSSITDGRGLRFSADSVCQSLEGFDLLVVPGGFGTRTLLADEPFLHRLESPELALLGPAYRNPASRSPQLHRHED